METSFLVSALSLKKTLRNMFVYFQNKMDKFLYKIKEVFSNIKLLFNHFVDNPLKQR